jgi:hypothetical protein
MDNSVKDFKLIIFDSFLFIFKLEDKNFLFLFFFIVFILIHSHSINKNKHKTFDQLSSFLDFINMVFSLYSLIEAAILCVNAVAILNEQRFLSRCKEIYSFKD